MEILRQTCRVAAVGAFLAGCIISLVPAGVHSQECDEYELYIHMVGGRDINGVAYDIALEGNYAYLADPFFGAVYVMDVTQPRVPELVRTVELNVNVQAITISAGLAYLATTEGLLILDLADPADPQPVGALPLGTPAVDVVVDGAYAFVAELDVGMQVVDVTDPATPELRHTVPGHLREIALQNDYAYLAAGSAGMKVVDIAPPEAASIVATLPLPGTASGIDVLADHVYVAVGGEGLMAVDVSNPLVPEPVGSLTLPQPVWSLDIAHGFSSSFAVVFGNWDGPFSTVDLTVPDEPTLIANFGGEGFAASFQDGLAFIAHEGFGLSIYDVSNPDIREPFHTENVEPYGEDIAAGDGLLFIATGSGWEGTLQVFSLADPTHPVLQSSLPLPIHATGVAVSGSYAFVFGYPDYTNILVIDAAEPTSPQIVETWTFPAGVVAMEVEGSLAYVVHHLDPPQDEFYAQLQVIEIADPLNPVFRGTLQLPEAMGLAVDGPRGAVTSNWTPGWVYPIPLVLLDLSDPDAPLIHGLIDYEYPTTRVAVRGYLVVVGEPEGPLPIVRTGFALDIYFYPIPGSGMEPELLDSASMFSAASEIIVTRTHVFVGRQVFDFTGFNQTYSMGATYGMGSARVLYGGTIYAVGPTGLSVFPPQCEFVVGVEEGEGDLPARTDVLSVRPNPFNPRAQIVFHLAAPEQVRIAIYDLTGKVVAHLADRRFPSGEQAVTWDGTDSAGRAVASGTYLVRLEAGQTTLSKKILLAR